MLHLSLGEQEFKRLVNGDVVVMSAEDEHQSTKVFLCLRDIGFMRMLRLIVEAFVRRER